MKKIVGVVIIALLFITVFTGCNKSKNDINQIKDVSTMLIKYTIDGPHILDSIEYITKIEKKSSIQIFSISSEDGNTIVNVETTLDYNDEKSIEKILVVQNGVVVNTIENTVGYYEDMYLDEKSSLVVIKYFGRKWSDFLLLDIAPGKLVFHEPFCFSDIMTVFEENNNKMEYETNDYDLMGFSCEKIVDSDLILIGYFIHDTAGKLQSGTFQYIISKHEFNNLQQNAPKSEG